MGRAPRAVSNNDRARDVDGTSGDTLRDPVNGTLQTWPFGQPGDEGDHTFESDLHWATSRDRVQTLLGPLGLMTNSISGVSRSGGCGVKQESPFFSHLRGYPLCQEGPSQLPTEGRFANPLTL